MIGAAMVPVTLTVNGAKVEGLVEPRQHLGDFLREQQRLTGTHLGCEQGVCGACTVELNGAPARACLAFAVACNGAEIRTVEGFAGDPLMARLRDAFSAEHALQCGFCTPGMLISAYDIVRRLPGADEARIRDELSGNLCRCTGYMGIVAAVKRVLAEQGGISSAPPRPSPLPSWERRGPSRSDGRVRGLREWARRNPLPQPPLTLPLLRNGPLPLPQGGEGQSATPIEPGWTRIADGFAADRPPAEIWALLGDVPRIAACLPGAVLESSDGENLSGRMQVKLGPIAAAFAGTATHRRDDATLTGVIEGSGGDQRSNSQARGRVTYVLLPEAGGQRTRVALTLDFALQGVLAQFSRSGLVKDLVGRMVRDFAANLAAATASGASATAPVAAAPLSAGNMLWAVLWARLKALLGFRQ